MVLRRTRLVQVGMGPIGIQTAKMAYMRDDIDLVGGIDVNPEIIGKDIGLLFGNAAIGKNVESDIKKACKKWDPDVAVLTTVSQVSKLELVAIELLNSGLHVVSSSEELLVPKLRTPEIAKNLDRTAKKNGVTMVAAGVNPGFAMDLLPLFVSTLCIEVNKISVYRCLDASFRRGSLQKKVGAGLTVEDFRRGEREGWIGHKGLQESIRLLAQGLEWKNIEIKETLDPIIAERDFETDFFEIKKGSVAGVHHVGHGKKDDQVLIEHDLKMFVGAEESFDFVQISGTPDLELKFKGGIPGDIATSATLLNTVSRAIEARPGLLTPLDLSLHRGVGRVL